MLQTLKVPKQILFKTELMFYFKKLVYFRLETKTFQNLNELLIKCSIKLICEGGLSIS